MKGGITAVRSTRFEVEASVRLPMEVQKKRLREAIRQELTPLQRETFLAYYFQDKSVLEIALERGVNKSTVWRTLLRAERRLKMLLKY